MQFNLELEQKLIAHEPKWRQFMFKLRLINTMKYFYESLFLLLSAENKLEFTIEYVDVYRKIVFRNDFDELSRYLRGNLQICFKCRNFFGVWWTAMDERVGLQSRNPDLNPNFNHGGGDRKSERRIPNALHFKTARPGLNLSENVPAGPNQIEDENVHNENIDDPAERSFEIGPEDENVGLEDPFDFNDANDEGDHFNDNESDGNNEEDDYDSDGDNSMGEAGSNPNNDGDDNNDGGNDNNESIEIESIGSPLVMDSAFMNGKILLLPVTDGNDESALCAICHQLAGENAEIITVLLENRLRLNPILSNAESFGIAFDYYHSNADFQLICDECLMTSSESNEGQTVYPKVFTIDFHKRCHNLSADHADNIQDLFNQSGSTVSYECVRELRSRIFDLEREIA